MIVLDLLFFIISILTCCDGNTIITCNQRTTTGPPTSAPWEPPPPPLPVAEACISWFKTDIVILNDISCRITSEQCSSQQGQISYVLRSIKGIEELDDDTAGGRPKTRVAYIEFDNININTIIALSNNTYNDLPVTAMDIDAYSEVIMSSATCNNAAQRASNPNLNEALQAAMYQFDPIGDSDNLQRDKKIIIFSNCKANNIEDICANYEDEIYVGVHRKGVNVIMVNNGDQFEDDDNYIMCLVEYDENRIFNNFDNHIFNNFDNQNIASLKDAVCSAPTPTPTTDPTPDPTQEPIAMNQYNYNNQNNYNTDTKHRLLEMAETDGKAPCIRLEVKLETENLVPLNTNPDPASNIAIIGLAIGNETNGVVTIPESPDLTEDDIKDIDHQLIWDIDPNCMIYNQMNESYWPSDTWQPDNLLLNITANNTGFTITIDFVTTDSIVYVFNIDALPLHIYHQCTNGDLMMKGAIYKNDVLMDETETITISAGDATKQIFNFDSTVSLTANRSYQIRFELINGYPEGCSLQNISFEEPNTRRSRRRLNDVIPYTDFEANAEANSCAFGAQLAQSPEMKTGVATMCNENLGDIRPEIEAGLFQQHASRTALKNHLFSTGSLHIYDPAGFELDSIAEFPENGVKEPCIAIDEENRILYAIGGHDGSGKAVDYIQSYQFDNDNLTEGHINISVSRGWTLDKARYGSTCLYWKKDATKSYLVVISGMDNNQSEFTSKGDFFKDIKMYLISPDCIEIGCYEPLSITQKLTNNVVDHKPLLIDNHLLYFFGGKTHVESKAFVQRFDLNNINIISTSLEVLELTKKKALPLIDQVQVDFADDNTTTDIKSCYIVFAGQSYNDSELISDGIQTDNLQLFCNEAIENEDGGRRRLNERNINIARLTEFDRRMVENDGNRGRLLDDGEITEVFVREYFYGLDGMWYNFTVEVEVCYDNNDQLKEAEMYYENIIDSKPNGDDWKEYKQNIDEKILKYSLWGYSGWSDGFGDVDVYDLDIVDVNYYYTPSPTKGYGPLSHPERRKARNWWKQYMDRNIQSDYVWIDDKLPADKDCDDESNDENDDNDNNQYQ